MNPPEEPFADPGDSRFQAHATDQAEIYQAGGDQVILRRDLHVHYEAGVRRARRVEQGVEPGECPYPGLTAFDMGQARWFFGRDGLIADLMVRLDEQLRNGGPLTLVAPSGAGKSSLLRAGLLPAIARGALPIVGSARWPLLLFTPTALPIKTLATHLADAMAVSLERVEDALSAGAESCVALVRAGLQRAEGEPAAKQRLVVIVDQLEELFTLCADERKRCEFLDLLSALAAPGPAGEEPIALVVYGLRSDFYTQCANYPGLRVALQTSQVLVGPLSRAGLHEAIQCPAQDVGLEIEPGLIELLLRDLGAGGQGASPGSAAETSGPASYEAGRLPLLAHALRVTWQQKHGSTLTVDGYQATGGIHRAIATTAEHRFNQLDKNGKKAARNLFLRLVKIGDDVNDTRRRVLHAELLKVSEKPASAAVVIQTFTEARLLVLTRDTVEITHEALLHAWPRLRQWIDTDRATNLLRQELEEAAVNWDRNHRESGALYRGNRLEAVRSWRDAPPADPLSPLATAFLATAVRQKRRSTQLRRSVIVVLSVLALIASGSAIFAFEQRASARAERDTAIVSRLAGEADGLVGTDRSLAAQLDLAAYRMRPTSSLRTRLISHANATMSTVLQAGYSGPVTAAAFSPDGRTLASAGGDQAIRLWSLGNPTHPKPLGKPLTGHTDAIHSVAFSPDGRTLVSAGLDLKVRLWNVADPARPKPLGLQLLSNGQLGSIAFSRDGHTLAVVDNASKVWLWNLTDPAHPKMPTLPFGGSDALRSVAISADGLTLAAGGDDTVRLWNIADPAHPKPRGVPLNGHTGRVYSVAFSPDGHTLASAGGDRTVRLWNIADPAHPKPSNPRTVQSGVFSVAFSPDGLTLASAGRENVVRLWNVSDPAHVLPLGEELAGHVGTVFSVAFSPDGHTLASASADRTVRLWSLPRTLLSGHTSIIFSLAFSPDGRRLASASADRTVRLWSLANPEPLGKPLAGHIADVITVVFSPDGRTLASAGRDRTIRLWDISATTRPKLLGKPLAENVDAVALAFSPDGRTLASTGEEHSVQLWNTTDPAHAAPRGKLINGHSMDVASLAFSPDGRTLASGAGNTVRLWNVADLTNPTPLSNPLSGHTGELHAVAFSPDGRTLASSGADQTIRLWNLANPAHPKPLGTPITGHAGAVRSVAFSPDGRTLASASHDQTVRLWNIADPGHAKTLGTPLNGHLSAVTSLAFSPDGHSIASTGADQTILLWRMSVDEAIEHVCTATSTLTQQQWKQYIPEFPFKQNCR
ncbi:NACHT and WD repeat domain-containing protein [Streptomyces lunaelactis]|uniref:NACHT and WD repeat domain-containing protein n=1 Tax=Streptomyces lunaelactis TaxID=1535768 RepID=UPI001585A894|nr:hypothetical protein [Streptomyces lunaelactis]NUK21953.1 hypothetical protein [Streptomyces lunaelactis]